MPSFDKLLLIGDNLTDEMQLKLVTSAKKSEKLMFEELIKVLKSLNVDAGRIQNTRLARQFLLTLDKKIENVLMKSDYANGVMDFVTDFAKIEENSLAITKVITGKNVPKRLINPLLQIETENAIDKLLLTGVKQNFTIPVREALYKNIALGHGVADAEETIYNYVVSKENADSKMLRYVKQVSRDTMQQFDGSIQEKVSDELELNGLIYAGSIIADSRPQCIKWVRKKEICKKDLQKEIAWALSNGSGMVKTTTPKNFFTYRGGYHCRHRAFAAFVIKCGE